MLEEATITNSEKQEPGRETQLHEPVLSTDDLVMMIGEAAVLERQSQKIIRILQQQGATLQKELLEQKSKSIAATDKASEPLRQRIVDLEKQVHETALERDALMKMTAKAKKGKKVNVKYTSN